MRPVLRFPAGAEELPVAPGVKRPGRAVRRLPQGNNGGGARGRRRLSPARVRVPHWAPCGAGGERGAETLPG